MKKRCLWITLLICFVIVVICSTLFEMEWRHPSGPPGKVQVHYTIPVTMPNGKEGYNGFSFWVAGHVQCAQLVPISGHNEHGFVMLYIKTTEGWYETPTASLGGPIDWTKGVEVKFLYPDGMKLRERTRLPIGGFYPVFAFRWDDILLDSLRWRGRHFGFGDDLDKGDIASVHFCHLNGGQKVEACRTTGFKHSGYQSWGADDGLAVEVTVSDK